MIPNIKNNIYAIIFTFPICTLCLLVSLSICVSLSLCLFVSLTICFSVFVVFITVEGHDEIGYRRVRTLLISFAISILFLLYHFFFINLYLIPSFSSLSLSNCHFLTCLLIMLNTLKSSSKSSFSLYSAQKNVFRNRKASLR